MRPLLCRMSPALGQQGVLVLAVQSWCCTVVVIVHGAMHLLIVCIVLLHLHKLSRRACMQNTMHAGHTISNTLCESQVCKQHRTSVQCNMTVSSQHQALPAATTADDNCRLIEFFTSLVRWSTTTSNYQLLALLQDQCCASCKHRAEAHFIALCCLAPVQHPSKPSAAQAFQMFENSYCKPQLASTNRCRLCTQCVSFDGAAISNREHQTATPHSGLVITSDKYLLTWHAAYCANTTQISANR